MTDLKTTLLKFVRVFTQHPVCLANAVLFAATTGIEQAFEHVVFKCPNKQPENKIYAVVSLLFPAIALWIVGILGSNSAWRLCQGLKYRQEKHGCSWFRPCCGNLTYIMLRTLVIPSVWVLVSLMDGHFYMCYHWRPTCPINSTSEVLSDDEPCTKDPDAWNKDNKANSQLIGWIMLTVCLAIALIAVFCYHCCSTRTYFAHIYANELKQAERIHLAKLLKAKAEEDAKKNAGEVIEVSSKMSPEHWESVCREYTKAEMEAVAPNRNEANQLHSPIQEFLLNLPSPLTAFKAARQGNYVELQSVPPQ